MLENKLFEALLDVIPFGAYAVDIDTYEVVYANKRMRENMYAPQESYCWAKVFGQEEICSWCSISDLKIKKLSRDNKEKYTCEFFDESDDRWLKSYDEIMSWPDGREVKYSILVDITDQKEIQGSMVKSHANLAMKTKQLTNTNKNLQITKLKLQKSLNELEEQKQKAQKATQTKSNFLANMSHEIRTPMNAIVGMMHLLKETNLDYNQQHIVQKIETASSTLLNIINDVLDFSKIEAGKLDIETIDFDMNILLENVSNIVEIKVIEKNLDFNIHYTNNQPIYFGDSLRIGQILTNLINNAVKFTSNGKIELYIKDLEEDKVEFRVIDTGIGIEYEHQQKIFKSFSQADAGTTRKYGGTGLGLAISKQFVELMGGEIWCKSEPGKGSEFGFIINLPKGDNNIAYKKDSLQQLKRDITTLRDSNILLVEDSQMNIDIIYSLLSFSGINIDTAHDGNIAVKMFNANPDKYELILMDLQMPNLDGYETASKIRQKNNSIPIIALSANVMKEDIDRVKDVGMNEHIGKPLEIKKFFTILLKYLSKKYEKSLEYISGVDSGIQLPELETVDLKKGMYNVGGKSSIYINILTNFYNNYRDLQIDKLDNETFYITIHTIKGLSLTMGARRLHKISNLLEENRTEEMVEKFNIELSGVIEELKSMVNEQISQVSNIISPKEPISKNHQEQLILKLKEAVLSKRPKNCIHVLEKLDHYILDEQNQKLLDEVKILIKDYRYKEAQELFP